MGSDHAVVSALLPVHRAWICDACHEIATQPFHCRLSDVILGFADQIGESSLEVQRAIRDICRACVPPRAGAPAAVVSVSAASDMSVDDSTPGSSSDGWSSDGERAGGYREHSLMASNPPADLLEEPLSSEFAVYAMRGGSRPGIYDCLAQVMEAGRGQSGARMNMLSSECEAGQWINQV